MISLSTSGGGMKRSLPIGVAMRRNQKKKAKSVTLTTENSNEVSTSTSVSELEEQIAKLEQELNESLSDEDSEEDSAESELEEEIKRNIRQENEFIEILDENGNVVAIKSRIEEEKINPLPKTLLPDPNCGATRSKQEKKIKKAQPPPQSQSGLEKSVREMLKNYKPTSAERRPFWCRICSFQAQNEQEFFQHRQSELHIVASKQERKFSTCKLCRKEFTSPEQLKEHLKGKAHLERLEYVKSRQQNGRRYESF